MIKRLLIAVVVLTLVVGGIVWFKFFRDDMIAQFLGAMKPAPVPVNVEVVEPVTWHPTIEAIGTTVAMNGVDLSIEAGGLVRAIDFKANDLVSEGQLLVQIDDDSERAALAAAEANLLVAKADQRRTTTLNERGVSASSTLEYAEAQTQSAQAQVTQVQTQLDARRLTAPFAGVIGIPRIEVGQYVSTGQTYATLQDLSSMRVDFSVPEQQIADLELGRTVTVRTEVGEFTAQGSIIGIEPRVDPNSRLILARAAIDTDGGIVPGQFLRVWVELPIEEGVIAVEQTAVSSSLYGDSIYVIRGEGDGKAEDAALTVEQVFVQLGRRSGGRIEVKSGLQVGDRIVISGQNRLSSGAQVVVDNSVSLVTAPGQ